MKVEEMVATAEMVGIKMVRANVKMRELSHLHTAAKTEVSPEMLRVKMAYQSARVPKLRDTLAPDFLKINAASPEMLGDFMDAALSYFVFYGGKQI